MEQSLSQPSVPIIGAWKLISFEIQTADGGIIYPFGENAQGALIYAESGRFSGQVMRPGRLSSHLEIRCEEQPRKSKPIIKVSYRTMGVTNLTPKMASLFIMWKALCFLTGKGISKNGSLS